MSPSLYYNETSFYCVDWLFKIKPPGNAEEEEYLLQAFRQNFVNDGTSVGGFDSLEEMATNAEVLAMVYPGDEFVFEELCRRMGKKIEKENEV